MINYLVLAIALVVATVAGYYSVIGLTTIFTGAFWPVVVMASSIEAAKVVCTSWLYRHWNTAPAIIKVYLTTAIVVLSFITSLGVFGFLSKAHTDIAANADTTSIELKTIDQQLEIEQKRLAILLEQANKYTGPVRRFEKPIEETQNKIVLLTTKKAPLLQQQNKNDAEVGPLKFIAELVYGKSDQSTLGSAVRSIIILIVFVFDPLAIVMILAANHGMMLKRKPDQQEVDWVEKVKMLKNKNKRGIMIDEKSLYKMRGEL